MSLPTLSAPVIESDRVLLRKARDADREGIIEVMTDPEVRTYLGGPRPREDVERFLDAAGAASISAKAGSYVIADGRTGLFIGTLRLDRRAVGRPGHVTGEGGGRVAVIGCCRRTLSACVGARRWPGRIWLLTGSNVYYSDMS